jgi:hypothetical protein
MRSMVEGAAPTTAASGRSSVRFRCHLPNACGAGEGPTASFD